MLYKNVPFCLSIVVIVFIEILGTIDPILVLA